MKDTPKIHKFNIDGEVMEVFEWPDHTPTTAERLIASQDESKMAELERKYPKWAEIKNSPITPQ